MSVIEISGLHKSYGDLVAVDGISLSITEGEVFTLLGPNGAGKTTIVEILEGYRSRDGGSARVLGEDPATAGRAFRERIGIVLQSSGLDGELTVDETVSLYAGFYPAARLAVEVIEIVGLGARRGARVKSLSGGERRRLDLALGIVGDPDLIFLDEPTTGFDPAARRRSWELIDRLRSLGKTILLTTHYMDEAQNLSDRVAVLVAGKIVAEGSPQDLVGGQTERTVISCTLPAGVPGDDLPAPFRADAAGAVRLSTAEPTAALHALTAWATGRGVDLEDLSVTRPTLEDVYLRLIGEAGDG
jgi:ABC-2 type transport system ATP-binding protein